MEVPVNYWVLLVGIIINVVLGALWYGPMMFQKPWMRMSGFTHDSMKHNQKVSMGTAYALMTLGSIIMAYTLWHVIAFGSAYTHMTGVSSGLQGAFWSWLGFIAPATLGTVLWEGKPWKLWMINSGYYLVALLLVGALFGATM
jgi:hypothetical protein